MHAHRRHLGLKSCKNRTFLELDDFFPAWTISPVHFPSPHATYSNHHNDIKTEAKKWVFRFFEFSERIWVISVTKRTNASSNSRMNSCQEMTLIQGSLASIYLWWRDTKQQSTFANWAWSGAIVLYVPDRGAVDAVAWTECHLLTTVHSTARIHAR